MEVKNKVSIFSGHFSSKENFENFTKENFTEDGDVNSELMKELNVDYIDNQFQEVFFSENNLTKDDINGFSYSENFIDKVSEKLPVFNSLILLYNFEFKELKELKELKLIGVFDYQ